MKNNEFFLKKIENSIHLMEIQAKQKEKSIVSAIVLRNSKIHQNANKKIAIEIKKNNINITIDPVLLEGDPHQQCMFLEKEIIKQLNNIRKNGSKNDKSAIFELKKHISKDFMSIVFNSKINDFFNKYGEEAKTTKILKPDVSFSKKDIYSLNQKTLSLIERCYQKELTESDFFSLSMITKSFVNDIKELWGLPENKINNFIVFLSAIPVNFAVDIFSEYLNHYNSVNNHPKHNLFKKIAKHKNFSIIENNLMNLNHLV